MTPSPQSNIPFASPPPWPQALSCRVYGRGLSPCEKKIATQELTAIELRGVLAQKRYRCTQVIWSEWGQGEWEWLEFRRECWKPTPMVSARGGRGAGTGMDRTKADRRAGATVARISRRRRLTMVKVAENQEMQKKKRPLIWQLRNHT